MKKLFPSLLFFLLLSPLLGAQSLDLGKQLYQNGDFERAARIFEQTDSPEARLFAGKSHFALGNFIKAKHYLIQAASESTDEAIQLEASYTKALNDFQLRDYTSSLEGFHQIRDREGSSVFISRSEMYYNQILQYLSLSQVLEVFKQTSSDQIRFDLLTSSIGKFDYLKARTILEKYKSSVVNTNRQRLASIEQALNDSIAYGQQMNLSKYQPAPFGMAYHIGVALPEFDIDSEQYEISQHLYFGIQLAVEEFNSENNSKKIFLRFANTNSETESPEAVLNNLVWKQDVDAIIGPLFSETARAFADLSQEYEVPIVTPLANSDGLDDGTDYMFQFNPTFSVRGTQMARYAVNELELDTLAVLAEKGSLGEAAAYGFRNEAEDLGAVIKYFFVEDLESTGYSILEYTRYFSQTDTLEPAAGLKGIYAPFTGAVAPSLISALLTDLEASQSNYVIMGSEEWMNTDLESRRLPETSIYYTKSFETDTASVATDNFDTNFRLRFQVDPNQFAYIGYDVASLLLTVIEEVENPDYIKEGLRNLNNYRGLNSSVRFDGRNVNQNIRIKSILQETEDLLNEENDQ